MSPLNDLPDELFDATDEDLQRVQDDIAKVQQLSEALDVQEAEIDRLLEQEAASDRNRRLMRWAAGGMAALGAAVTGAVMFTRNRGGHSGLESAVDDIRADGLMTADTLGALRATPELATGVLDRVATPVDGVATARAVMDGAAERLDLANTVAAPPHPEVQNLSEQLASAMARGGEAAGGESAQDVRDVLGRLAAQTNIAQDDLLRAYTGARDTASAALDGASPTAEDYQTIMDAALKGVNDYVARRSEVTGQLAGLAGGTPAATPSVADTPPLPGDGIWQNFDAIQVVGGVLAVWSLAHAGLQYLQSRDPQAQANRDIRVDGLDLTFQATRFATSLASMAGVANPLTAMVATGATLAHLSRKRTLQQLESAKEKNHNDYYALQMDSEEAPHRRVARLAQMAWVVGTGGVIKAQAGVSHILNTVIRQGIVERIGSGLEGMAETVRTGFRAGVARAETRFAEQETPRETPPADVAHQAEDEPQGVTRPEASVSPPPNRDEESSGVEEQTHDAGPETEIETETVSAPVTGQRPQPLHIPPHIGLPPIGRPPAAGSAPHIGSDDVKGDQRGTPPVITSDPDARDADRATFDTLSPEERANMLRSLEIRENT